MLENKEIKTEDLILAYETLKQENIDLKARCRSLSHRNLILETENADLNLSNCLNSKDFARSFGAGVE